MAFSIISESTKSSKRYKLIQRTVEFKLNQPSEHLEDPEQWLKDGLKVIYDYAIKDVKSSDKVGIMFSSDVFQSDLNLPFRAVSELKFGDVWSLLHELYQSNGKAEVGDVFKLTVSSLSDVQGKGLHAVLYEDPVTNLVKEDYKECPKCLKLCPKTESGVCDKCYIKGGSCANQFIPFSNQSWDNYEAFKKWQYAYDRKKVQCDICGKEMLRTSIYRHKALWHKYVL